MQEQGKELEGNIADLRSLLLFVGRQSMSDEKGVAEENEQLQEQAEQLQKRLQKINKGGKHLHRVERYWAEFLN